MKTLSLVAISCLFILFCVSASSSNQNLFDPPLWFAKFHENAYLPGVVQIVHATSGFLLKYSKAFVLPRVHMFQLNNATGIKLTREELEIIQNVAVSCFEHLKSIDLVEWYELNEPRSRKRRGVSFNDPAFKSQWHLQDFSSDRASISATSAWKQGYSGKGITIAIVDDGVQYWHPELQDHFSLNSSWDVFKLDHHPTPQTSYDHHGTQCATVAAAKENNHICGVGIAYDAAIAGIRLLGEVDPTGADEAVALTYKNDINHIYSCSWGPDDDGETVEAPSNLANEAIKNAIQNGRNGLGSIFVFAVGNGAQQGDNCNYDGYTNSKYTITAAAIGKGGSHAWYSEPCAAILVSTPSNDGRGKITTASLSSLQPGNIGDVAGSCTSTFGGTSESAASLSGVIALILEANPSLTWRDVQHILVRSTDINDPSSDSWSKNGAGYKISHLYGFGTANAAKAVNTAKSWKLVEEEQCYKTRTFSVNKVIPTGGKPLEVTARIPPNLDVEHVTVTFTADHDRASDLEIILKSPHGTKSYLAENHGVSEQAELHIETSDALKFKYKAYASSAGPTLHLNEWIKGDLYAAEPLDGCNLGDVENHIVLVNKVTAECSLVSKIWLAQQRKAKGLVFISPPGYIAAFHSSYKNITVPSVTIRSVDADNILKLLYENETMQAKIGLNVVKSKDRSTPYKEWNFGSVLHWGETSSGVWSLSVADKFEGVDDGELKVWTLEVCGTKHHSNTLKTVILWISVVGAIALVIFISLMAVRPNCKDRRPISRNQTKYERLKNPDLELERFGGEEEDESDEVSLAIIPVETEDDDASLLTEVQVPGYEEHEDGDEENIRPAEQRLMSLKSNVAAAEDSCDSVHKEDIRSVDSANSSCSQEGTSSNLLQGNTSSELQQSNFCEEQSDMPSADLSLYTAEVDGTHGQSNPSILYAESHSAEQVSSSDVTACNDEENSSIVVDTTAQQECAVEEEGEAETPTSPSSPSEPLNYNSKDVEESVEQAIRDEQFNELDAPTKEAMSEEKEQGVQVLYTDSGESSPTSGDEDWEIVNDN